MIKSFTAEHFRNLSLSKKLTFSDFNLIFGDNGSGKTSLLEAIYFLIMGRSFRATKLDRIITHQARSFRLTGVLAGSPDKRIGLERSLDTPSINRLDGKNVAAQAQITILQPVQLLNYDSYRLLVDAASYRRKFLDWGLFHERADFIDLWRRFERVLRQRNIGLKERKLSREAFKPFNYELAKLGSEISTLRREYLKKLEQILNEVFQQQLPDQFNMVYHPGWPENEDLLEVIEREFVKDQQVGYTNSGPQRADWWIEFKDQRKVRDVYSRGQQKLLAFTLQLAQGLLLYRTSQRSCVYLIDDPLAELDDKSYRALECQLAKLPQDACQFFITSLKLKRPKSELVKLYPKWQALNIEHGQLTQFS